MKEEGKKKKEEGRIEDWTQEKKGGKKSQKVQLWVPPCVFNYKNAIELWIMETENTLWKLKTTKMCFQFP